MTFFSLTTYLIQILKIKELISKNYISHILHGFSLFLMMFGII